MKEFIIKQWKSLKKLEVGFPYVMDEKIVNSIMDAISELEELTDLKIYMHRSELYPIATAIIEASHGAMTQDYGY
ncbi:MAG: hypothetical protein EOO43_25415 [Flavobacterium sp.]|nr:MAG: hypothetical protein EOO43_25415 [Flavobacterium sp.]